MSDTSGTLHAFEPRPRTPLTTAAEAVLTDLRLALRRLRRAPSYTLVTTVTLALGIGASTAMFSVVRPVLLQALPYPNPERLVVIADASGTDGAPIDVTFGTFREIAERSRTIARAAVSRPWLPTLAVAGDAARLDGQSVSADYFRVLGVSPSAGRDFADADDAPGAAPVAIVSHSLWRRWLNADPGAIGRTITLDGAAVTVVGVMPPAFENVLSPEAQVWRPLGYDRSLPQQGREWGHHLQLLARLAPGSDPGSSLRELAAIARTPVSEFDRPAWADLRDGFVVTSLQDQISTAIKPALTAVVLATALLLVIAMVNVVNLMLARGVERRGEAATCAAFGASRARLVTPALAEAVLLAGMGGLLGVALAYALVNTLVTMDGVSLPRLETIRVDRRALAFAAMLSAVIGIAAGFTAAFVHRRPFALMSNPRLLSTTHRRVRYVFVAAEVAVALVLLVGAGLLVRTVQQLMAVPLGFEPAGVVTLQVQSSGIGSTESDAITRRFADIRDAVERVPGVTSTGLASQLPFTGDADVYGIATRSDSHLPNGADRSAFRYAVSPGYLETLGIPLLSGRTIDERDRADGARVAVISSSLARRRFPDQRPLGKSLRIGGGDLWFTVVGVVGDTKQSSLTTASPDAVYVPAVQWTFADRAMWVTARTAGDPVVLVDDIRRTIAAVAPDQPIVRVATMDQRVRASTARQRFVLAAFYAFAVIAVLLATIGVYGVLAAGVTERTRELALRSAVGASRTSLVTLVLRQAGIVTAAGMVIGAGVSIAATRTLESLLFGVSPLDAMTYAGVALLMVAAMTIGALLPAWRAGRIEPALALRAQ